MNYIIDREKLREALELTALASRNPTNQSGEFGNRDELLEVVLRIRSEISVAMLNWATVEAFNNNADALFDGLSRRIAGETARFAIKALVRDVIACLMRISDAPGTDRQSLCRLAKEFSALSLDALVVRFGGLADDLNAARSLFLASVPVDWTTQPEPVDGRLRELRTTFRPIRDVLIAHALDYSNLELKRDIPKVREFLKLSASLTDAACIVCNVSRLNLQEHWDGAIAQGTAFWDVFLAVDRKSKID
ncbi:MAG: hypothetical protein ABL898_18200 [Hyphomicrobiaceae bacterium]